MIKRCLLFILLVFLNSCLPFPHRERTFPEIQGQLLPAIDLIKVSYTDSLNEEPCQSKKFVFSDQGGYFILPAEYQTENFYTIGIVHIQRAWNLCFTNNKQQQFKWQGHTYGPVNAPAKIKLLCDLKAQGELCKQLNLG